MSQRQINEPLPTIHCEGYGASLDGYAVGLDPDNPQNGNRSLWYASLLGSQEALKAIRANLLKGKYAAISEAGMGHALYAPLAPIGKSDWRWKLVSLPRAGGHHGLLLPKLASHDHDEPRFLLLPRQGDEEQALFYRFLNRRVRIGLHPTWAEWLWQRAVRSGELTPCTASGRGRTCAAPTSTPSAWTCPQGCARAS